MFHLGNSCQKMLFQTVKHKHVYDRLRSKLAHALALLRMYQHKVQLLDAAASHQQAPHPVATNTSQSASDGIPMQEAQSTAVQRSQAACDGQGSLPEAAVALSGAAGIPDEVLQRAGLSVNDSSGGSSGGVGHRSDQRSSPRQLQSSSLGSESLEEPNKGTQLPCAQVLEDCTVSQGVKYQRQAEANANKPAEGQKASDEPHAGSDCSSKHPSEAPTQLHKLRFDPTVGTCGAFFIVEDNESSAASEAGSDSKADASLAQLEAPSNQSQHPAAGRISLPSHNSSRELAEQPREDLPLPTASRPETGRSSQQSLAEDAGVPLSQKGSSPRQTERCSSSSSSSAGLISRQFGGSLIDLVAEVEQLIGQGSSTHHNRSYYSTSGSCARSDIASDGPSNDEVARALQGRYCQQWIGNLVGSACPQGVALSAIYDLLLMK
jgi:hypothetical protein